MALPSGFHYADPLLESRHEDNLCWSDVEVETRLIESQRIGPTRPILTCGYCRSSYRFRAKEIRQAVEWFHSHPCGVPTEATVLVSAPERIPLSVAA